MRHTKTLPSAPGLKISLLSATPDSAWCRPCGTRTAIVMRSAIMATVQANPSARTFKLSASLSARSISARPDQPVCTSSDNGLPAASLFRVERRSLSAAIGASARGPKRRIETGGRRVFRIRFGADAPQGQFLQERLAEAREIPGRLPVGQAAPPHPARRLASPPASLQPPKCHPSLRRVRRHGPPCGHRRLTL